MRRLEHFRHPSKRCVLLCLWPAAMASLATGIWTGAARFPGGFDWQYQVISSLASREDNPAGYAVFCIGLALCFLLLLPLPGYFHARLVRTAPGLARASATALRVGLVGSIAIGVERLAILDLGEHIHKGHEAIALVAFLGLFCGVAGFWLAAVKLHRRARSAPTWLMVVLFVAVISPIAGTAASQLYLYVTQADLGWVGPEWRERGVPLFLSFAVWQWLTGVGVLLYLPLIAALLPAEVPRVGGRIDPDPHGRPVTRRQRQPGDDLTSPPER